MSNILTPLNSCDSESTHQRVSNTLYAYERVIDSEISTKINNLKKMEPNNENFTKSQNKELRSPPLLRIITDETSPPKLTPIKYSNCKSVSFQDSNNSDFQNINSKMNVQKSHSIEKSLIHSKTLNSNFENMKNTPSLTLSYKSENYINNYLGINKNSDESDSYLNTNNIQQSTDFCNDDNCNINSLINHTCQDIDLKNKNDFNFIVYQNQSISQENRCNSVNENENVYDVEMLGNNITNLDQLINSCDPENFSVDAVVRNDLGFDNNCSLNNLLNNGVLSGENLLLPSFSNSFAFGDESSMPLGTSVTPNDLLFAHNEMNNATNLFTSLNDYEEVALFGDGAAIQRHFYETDNDKSSQFVIARPPGSGSFNTPYFNNEHSIYNPETLIEFAQTGYDPTNTFLSQSQNSFSNFNQDYQSCFNHKKRSQTQSLRNVNERRKSANNRKRRDSQDPQAAVKRENHNMLERRRRSELRDSFAVLVDLIPELRGVSFNRLSKVKILIAATNYIKCFQSTKSLRERLLKERKSLIINITQKLEECNRKFNTPYHIKSQDIN